MYVIKYTDTQIETSRLFESQSGNPIWIKKDGTIVDMKKVYTVIEAALQDLAQCYPSIERIMKHKDIFPTDNPHIRTMATDGVSIMYNPAFVEYLIKMDEERGPLYVEYVLIHEALHVLFDHCNKHMASIDKYSDADIVNQAQDYEINYTIENFLREGPGIAPFKGVTNKLGGCYSDEFGKKGLTWEEMYPLIPKIKRTKDLEETSDEWKRGFADGYAEVMAKLRKEKLVEKCVTM